MEIAGKRVGAASKFACVRAYKIIDAPLDQVYDLFTDNSRVQEYNEYCKFVRDLEWLDPQTKITHSMTGRPWSRDFVTRVHYRELDENTKLVVNRGEEHEEAHVQKGYTRMDMPLGANLMRRLPGDETKTEFTVITHVNPGGVANTHFGSILTNRLSTDSPRQFLEKLNEAACRSRTGSSSSGAKRRPPTVSALREAVVGPATGVAAAAAAAALVTLVRRRAAGDSAGNDDLNPLSA
eukprot:Tamp_12393.p1 GENE.Tamp_12393~~Tamp_12393.p1  ORF type:complete len:237 (+),score=53.46 Tamp_12393:879-1589(+)